MNDIDVRDDHALLIPKDNVAVVVDPAGKISLMIPKGNMADDDEMPEMVQFLVACFLRHDDRAFFEEQVGWIQDRIAKKRTS